MQLPCFVSTALRWSGALTVCLIAAPAVGQLTDTPALADSAFVLQLDNDEFAGINAKDRWYTSGIRISKVWRSAIGSGSLSGPIGTLCAGVSTEQSIWQTRFIGVGQNIYTQSVRSRRIPRSDDRPIAGYLFSSFGAAMGDAEDNGAIAFELGLTGPGAFGEQVQNGMHDLLGRTEVPAWSYQLRPRLGANLHLDCVQRWKQTSIDWLSGYSLSAGSILTQASVQLALVAGPGRRASRFVNEARLATPGLHRSKGWAFMAGARARFVAYDAFLDGDTYRYRSTTRSRSLVGEFFISVSVNLVRDWQLEYTLLQRTSEFDGPGVAQADYQPQRFGAITLLIPL